MHRVLIIEDEQDIRYILSVALARLEYDTVAAKNGIEFFATIWTDG
jgi:CheY-like chemotaxis protein